MIAFVIESLKLLLPQQKDILLIFSLFAESRNFLSANGERERDRARAKHKTYTRYKQSIG